MCVSVKSHLTSGAPVFPENTVMYSGVQRRSKKICGFSLKPLHYQDPALPPLKAIRTVGHFPTESMHEHYSTCCIYHVAVDRSSHFFLCGGAKKIVGHELSFVSCHWSCLQARSVHNGMKSWHGGFCTLVHSLLQ